MIPILMAAGLLIPNPGVTHQALPGVKGTRERMRDLDDHARRHNEWMKNNAPALVTFADQADRLADELDPAKTATGEHKAAKLRAAAKQMRASAEKWKTGPLKTFDK